MPEQIFKVEDERSQATDGFDNFVSKVGLNNNNTLSASFYTFNLMTRNRTQLEAAYRGSWVVGQMIDVVAEDMTKAGINVTTTQKNFDIRLILREISRRSIGASLCSLLKWGRLYGGAIAVLDIEGQDLGTPLDVKTVSKGQFKGLVVYDRWQINPVLFDLIKMGPSLGLPQFYDIVTGWDSTDPNNTRPNGQVRIHHSRIIRNIGIELPYFQAITEMLWGESCLERLWDRLISFDNTTMSAANLVERANNRTVKINGLRQIIASGGDAELGLVKQFEMMREFQTNEGLTLLDMEDEFDAKVYTFSGLSDLLLQFGQQLAGACGIPLVRLFGQSPAGLSATGDSDLRTYYDNINSQQNAKLTSAWELILKVMWPSTFGQPLPDDVDFSFVPLWQMSDLDKATVVATNTQSILNAKEAGAIDNATAMKELRDMSGDFGLFSNITDEDITLAEETDDPPEPDASLPEADPPESIEKPKVKKPTVRERLKDWLKP